MSAFFAGLSSQPRATLNTVESEVVAAWLAIERGEAQLTWGLWSAPVEHSNALTDAGKQAVRATVDAVAEYLGEDWLARFLPNGTRSSRSGLPLMSWHWWPSNDVPHVYAPIGAGVATSSLTGCLRDR